MTWRLHAQRLLVERGSRTWLRRALLKLLEDTTVDETGAERRRSPRRVDARRHVSHGGRSSCGRRIITAAVQVHLSRPLGAAMVRSPEFADSMVNRRGEYFPAEDPAVRQAIAVATARRCSALARRAQLAVRPGTRGVIEPNLLTADTVALAAQRLDAAEHRRCRRPKPCPTTPLHRRSSKRSLSTSARGGSPAPRDGASSPSTACSEARGHAAARDRRRRSSSGLSPGWPQATAVQLSRRRTRKPFAKLLAERSRRRRAASCSSSLRRGA